MDQRPRAMFRGEKRKPKAENHRAFNTNKTAQEPNPLWRPSLSVLKRRRRRRHPGPASALPYLILGEGHVERGVYQCCCLFLVSVNGWCRYGSRLAAKPTWVKAGDQATEQPEDEHRSDKGKKKRAHACGCRDLFPPTTILMAIVYFLCGREEAAILDLGTGK